MGMNKDTTDNWLHDIAVEKALMKITHKLSPWFILAIVFVVIIGMIK